MEIKPVNFIEGKFYENAVFVNLEAASIYNKLLIFTTFCLSFVFRFKFFKAAFNQIYAFN